MTIGFQETRDDSEPFDIAEVIKKRDAKLGSNVAAAISALRKEIEEKLVEGQRLSITVPGISARVAYLVVQRMTVAQKPGGKWIIQVTPSVSSAVFDIIPER